MIQYYSLKELIHSRKNLFEDYSLPFQVFTQYLLDKNPELKVPGIKDNQGLYHFVLSGEISGNKEAPYFWLFTKEIEMAEKLIKLVLEKCPNGLLYFDHSIESAIKGLKMKEIEFEKDLLFQNKNRNKDELNSSAKLIFFTNENKPSHLTEELQRMMPPQEFWEKMENKYVGFELQGKIHGFLDYSVNLGDSVFIQNLFIDSSKKSEELEGRFLKSMAGELKRTGKKSFYICESKDFNSQKFLVSAGFSQILELFLISWN